MNDPDFLYQFEHCTLPKEYFTHKGHLHIAWLYLNKFPYPIAKDHIANGIKKYAASLGASQKYHETVTTAWIKLVAAAINKNKTETFAAFWQAHHALHNSKLLHEYYSTTRLNSETAQREWMEPDLKMLD